MMYEVFIYLFFFSGGLFCFNIYQIKCCDFHLSELWFKCLVEGLQGTKWKLSHQQKLWWRQQPEDRSRLISWPLSAAMFVLVNCTQEEQPWSKEEEKLWSHISSHSTSPPSEQVVRCVSAVVRVLLQPADPQLLMDPTEGPSLSVLHFPLLLQLSAETCWPWDHVSNLTPPNSLWLAGEANKSLSFLRYCMLWKHNSKEE